MSCSALYSVAAPMKSCGIGPRCSRGTTRSPGNWITRCIVAVWLVSFIVFFGVWFPFFFPYTFFDFFHRGIQGVRVSADRTVACSPMSLPSTCPTQLGRAVLGSNLFVLKFFFSFVRFMGICGKSACVPHIPVDRSSYSWRSM